MLSFALFLGEIEFSCSTFSTGLIEIPHVKNSQYKKGVLEIISRARQVNPQIGNYQDHQPSGPDHFQIKLSNGTLMLPRQVAHSQQEFPNKVSSEWVAEIANTFEQASAEARNESKGFFGNLFSKFRG